MGKRIIRVLLAKVGLDGHDRGARVVATGLRDAGMEVIYTGLRSTPDEVARIAIEEDVDVVGLSILSGAHRVLVRRVIEKLDEHRARDIPLVVGGIIPARDEPYLESLGAKKIFGPGSKVKDIIRFINSLVENRKGAGNA